MAVGAIATKKLKNSALNRLFKSSPDYTVPSRCKIGTGTTTPAESDTDLATPITAWNSGSDYKNYASGYPTFDESNKRVTWRLIVEANQANSNTITEIASFNTDGTPIIGDRYVVTGIPKTSAIRVIFDGTVRMV